MFSCPSRAIDCGRMQRNSMMEIRAETLIKAVKARPALYNKVDSQYNPHNKYKSKIWREVCKEVIPNWEQLRPSKRLEYDLELQKRWKSLRTCFARELALQRKEQQQQLKKDDQDEYGYTFKRRKRYEYFNDMSFLLNPEDVDITITDNNRDNDDGNRDTDERTRDTDDDRDSDDNNSSDPLNREFKIENLLYPETSKTRNVTGMVTDLRPDEHQQYSFYDRPQFENRVIEEKILDLLKDKKKEEEDDDRQFMLSLVPGFKKLNDRQKYDAKIEILKVIRKVSYENDKSVSEND